jgi:hypothetical protein
MPLCLGHTWIEEVRLAVVSCDKHLWASVGGLSTEFSCRSGLVPGFWVVGLVFCVFTCRRSGLYRAGVVCVHDREIGEGPEPDHVRVYLRVVP